MSAVSGLASKGEKGKAKFQSLDINSLYRSTLGESAEPQQKTLPRKHGMQSLGKVPSARRPPANLPSLKSEHSGQEPPVSLVPSGGAGWGAKGESEESATTATASSSTSGQTAPATNQLSTSASGAATPAPSLPSTAPPVTPPVSVPVAAKSSGPQEKLWSSLMSGGGGQGGPDNGPSFLAHQNPMFQQEFPSLSTDQQGAKSTAQDVQYGPGPSLRPQTEGSWMQGGMARAPPLPGGLLVVGDARGGAAMDLGKGNSGPLGAAPPASGQGGPSLAAPLPPQLRGIIPPFMYRNFGPGGGPSNFPPTFQGNTNSRQRYPDQSRQPQGQRYPSQRPVDDDALFSRPIIKEEDLKQMDEIVRDNGWATTDDIDYNQKLSFSDEEGDEGSQSRPSKQSDKQDAAQRGSRGAPAFPGKQTFGGNSGAGPPIALIGDEEFWREKRRQQSEDVALAVERAKQRKEEEEKRFKDQREAAAKKLQMLEEKMGVNSGAGGKAELLNEKEVDDKVKSSMEGSDSWVKQVEESSRPESLPSATEGEQRKERPREGAHENVAFSPKFSEDLPPRFAKQKQMLLRTNKPGQKGVSPPPPQTNTPPPLLATPIPPPPNFEQRWNLNNIVSSGRGQARRRSSQEQDDFEDQKGRDQDKQRHGDRHDRYQGSRRDGRKISEGSRKDKSDDDHYNRQQSSEERSEPSEIGHREKDYGNNECMEILPPHSQIDPFDDKDLCLKFKDATPPPLIVDMALKGKPRADKWNMGQVQHQRQDSERSDDSRGKRGPKLDAWSRDDSLVAKLRGDDDSKLDMGKIDSKKDDLSKLDDDRKAKGRGQRGERGPRAGKDGRDNRDNRDNRDANWSTGGNAFAKTWARTGEVPRAGDGKLSDGRGKGRGSKLHPAPGSKPGKAWGEDESDLSDEEIMPKDAVKDDKRVRKPPKQLKDGPDERKGTIIGSEKKSGEKMSKPGNSKEGFAPRGEPSRRGRGGGSNSRPRGGMGRGIDGYGPPAKSPFGNRDENRKSDSKTGDDMNKTKLGGMVPLSSSVANAKQGKQQPMPPRMQKAKDGSEKSGRRKGKGAKSPSRGEKTAEEHNDETWDSLSDSEDDQEGRGPRKGASPRSNHFSTPSLTTSKAPGAEKKNGLGSVGARSMGQGKKENVPLTEAAKRLEKEKSALDALDISTYAAVTSLVDDQISPDADGSQFLSSYNYQKKKRSNSPPRDRGPPINRGGKGPFGPPPPQGQQQQMPMGMKPGPKSGNYERPHDRSRASKLPPRLAKQKEVNRMNKAAANMPHHLGTEMLDMYVSGDSSHSNSWDKSLADPLRGGSPLASCVTLIDQDTNGSLPVPQITPVEGEDTADMKLDFAFDSSELLEDKNKTRSGGHSVSSAPSSVSSNSTMSPSTAELNLKIASVKKVWENATMPTVLEHSQDDFSTAGFEQALDSSFKEASSEENLPTDVSYSVGQTIVSGGTYAAVPGGLSATSLAGKTDPTTTSSNVCKVKPQQQQMAMSAGQSPIGHQNQLSPPPYNSSSTSSQHSHLGYTAVQRSAGVDNMSCWQHTGTAAPGFGGISAIPSPPTVLFNTNQQLQQASGLYSTFQLDNQRSQYSQYPPYGLGNNNAATGFSQQSLYMQQPPPPPPTAQGSDMYPPSLSQYRLQATATPYGQTQHVTSNPSTVLISTTSNSLMSASVKPSTQPIGAIGSKGFQTSAPPPPPQVPYKPNAMYIYDHQAAAANLLGLSGPGFMTNAAPLVQRQTQVQNNVVPAIQAPSSYFSNSAAPGQGAFYQTNNPPPPHPSAAAAGALHSSNNPYATNMSGFAQNTANSGSIPGFNTTPQMVAAAVQGYRNAGNVAAANYMKSAQQNASDLSGRQLKSPAQDQLGPSVFSSSQMNASPKGRGNSGGGNSMNKQPPLPSPTLGQQNQQQGQKYGGYSSNSMGLQQSMVGGGRNSGPRGPSYPSPIQRPNFQQNSMSGPNRPRMPTNQQQRGKGGHSGQGSNLIPKIDQPSGDKQPTNNPNKETNGSSPVSAPPAALPVDLTKKTVEKKQPVGVPTVSKGPVVAPAVAPSDVKEESITKEEGSKPAAQCVE
ncbi:protein PRRC2C isoform X2 [Neocloeon triangulifer]|uniref:protein PRRC2C isoform X2 n=1 Tax=Neocloeon triangulifer TaxID=2078957 RepID=UPI00286F307A|nr:protein PRRC2C isoform X2 [Neocloeon triangulifer]